MASMFRVRPDLSRIRRSRTRVRAAACEGVGAVRSRSLAAGLLRSAVWGKAFSAEG